MVLDKVKLWETIEASSRISKSMASINQRALARAFKTIMTSTGQSLDPPHEVTVKQTVEKDSGKLVSKLG